MNVEKNAQNFGSMDQQRVQGQKSVITDIQAHQALTTQKTLKFATKPQSQSYGSP